MRRAPRSRSAGFTLLEVLVAVTVMGLAGAGALRLVVLSERALAEARHQRLFVEEVSRLRLDLLYGKVSDSGTRDGLSWETRKQNRPVLGDRWSVRYRTLSVRTGNRSIELILP
jgi:prepilin-type N-terminal cleavage/methylation domain-containing protein